MGLHGDEAMMQASLHWPLEGTSETLKNVHLHICGPQIRSKVQILLQKK